MALVLWLRAGGRFCHLPPAQCVFVPNAIVGEGDEHAAWKAVREIFHCLAGRAGTAGGEPCVLIVTHGDIDGMVAAAIMIRTERHATSEVAYSSARHISGKLQQILRLASPPKRLYVYDIPTNAGACAAVDALNRAGVQVRWIDHHPWDGVTPEQMQQVCREVVHHESTSAPAGVLAGRWRGKLDPYCKRVGRICYAYERGTEWQRSQFRLLASYVGKGRKGVLDRLDFDQPLTQEDQRRIEAMRIAAEAEDPPRPVTEKIGFLVFRKPSKAGT